MQYWYLIIYPVVVIEWPIATFLVWYLVSIELLNPFVAYIVTLFGDVTSDVLHYFVWYYWWYKFIEKYGHYIWISAEKTESISHTIHNNKIKTILWKLVYWIWWLPIVACGLARIPMTQFLLILIPISMFQTTTYMILWYYFWEFYDNVLKYLNYWWYIFGAISIVIIAVYIYLYKIKK